MVMASNGLRGTGLLRTLEGQKTRIPRPERPQNLPPRAPEIQAPWHNAHQDLCQSLKSRTKMALTLPDDLGDLFPKGAKKI